MNTIPAVPRYDAVVVGAGPYGLSTAAHLLGHGLSVAVFGRPLELWRQHMPKGMLLRSHWWATNLSDPDGAFGFARFFRDSGRCAACYPMPRDMFVEYALWFRERAVPDVDETYVETIRRQRGRFQLALQDGRSVESEVVVMATGFYPYAHRPAQHAHLPPDRVSHSCEHRDLSRFAGQRVVVIGGGQSAIEYAALLHEAGATTEVIARRPIRWLAPDHTDERTIVQQILAPNTSIAPGWGNWVLQHYPYLLYRFPQASKDRCNRVYLPPTASDWLRERVLGKVILREGARVVALEAVNGRVDVALSDGERVNADHVILATGFQVDVNKLRMMHPSLRAEIDTDMASPVLSPWFESSVPGLYFVGLTSMHAFGPLYRFVAGCGATARRVARNVANTMAGVA